MTFRSEKGLEVVSEMEAGRFMHVFDVRGAVDKFTDDQLIFKFGGIAEASYVRRYGLTQAVVYAWWD